MNPDPPVNLRQSPPEPLTGIKTGPDVEPGRGPVVVLGGRGDIGPHQVARLRRKPSNPDFLLRPGELLQFAAAHGLFVVAYENGFASDPDRYIQRIAAIRPQAGDAELRRNPLRGI